MPKVYETSAFLSVVFDKPDQASPILATLLREVYPKFQGGAPETKIASSLQKLNLSSGVTPGGPSAGPADPTEEVYRRNTVVFLHLLDLLVTHYPSQSLLQSSLRVRRENSIPAFVSSLASSARRGNYIAVARLLEDSNPLLSVAMKTCDANPGRQAIHRQLNALREKVRPDAWRALRVTYREVNLNEDGAAWLSRQLLLDSTSASTGIEAVQIWMASRAEKGETAVKVGTRWTLTRP